MSTKTEARREIYIGTRRIRRNGLRGTLLSVPKFWMRYHEIEHGDDVDMYVEANSGELIFKPAVSQKDRA